MATTETSNVSKPVWRLVETREPIEGLQGKVEVYSAGEGFAQITAVEQNPTQFFKLLLGERKDFQGGLLVSPNLGILEELVYKKKSDLKRPSPELKLARVGNTEYALTPEDSLHLDILQCPSVVADLVDEGWRYFGGFKPIKEKKGYEGEGWLEGVEDDELKTFNDAEIGSSPLTLLAKRLSSDAQYSFQLTELAEIIGAVGEETAEKAEVLNSRRYIDKIMRVLVPNKEGRIALTLRNFREFILERKTGHEGRLDRRVLFNVSLKPRFVRGDEDSAVDHLRPEKVLPLSWNFTMQSRVRGVAQAYALQLADSLGLPERTARVYSWDDAIQVRIVDCSVDISLETRRRFIKPATKNLVAYAIDLRRFIRRAIEGSYTRGAQEEAETLKLAEKLGVSEASMGRELTVYPGR